jgi:hypothetical protein
LKEEKEIQEGREAWYCHMDINGFNDIKHHDPCLLYQVYGPPPEPDALSSSEEEIPLTGKKIMTKSQCNVLMYSLRKEEITKLKT